MHAVRAGHLQLADGCSLDFDECLWCTQASASGWLVNSGLPLATDGFLAVNEFLQSDGGPANVFAAGDVATMTQHPRPKAGVYAVRAVTMQAVVFCCLLPNHESHLSTFPMP